MPPKPNLPDPNPQTPSVGGIDIRSNNNTVVNKMNYGYLHVKPGVFGNVRPQIWMSMRHLQSENCKRVQFTTSYMESYHLDRYTSAKEFILTPCIGKLLNINITKPTSLGVISLTAPFS